MIKISDFRIPSSPRRAFTNLLKFNSAVLVLLLAITIIEIPPGEFHAIYTSVIILVFYDLALFVVYLFFKKAFAQTKPLPAGPLKQSRFGQTVQTVLVLATLVTVDLFILCSGDDFWLVFPLYWFIGVIEILFVAWFFIATFVCTFQFFRKRESPRTFKLSLMNILMVFYLLTWVIGVPWVVISYKGYVDSLPRYGGFEERPSGPVLCTPSSSVWPLPVLPGVIVSNDSYMIEPLNGMGSIDCYVFYLAGIKKIFGLVQWVS